MKCLSFNKPSVYARLHHFQIHVLRSAKVKETLQLPLVINSGPRHNGVWKGSGTTPHIHKIGITCR
jgi:hypothetical protein